MISSQRILVSTAAVLILYISAFSQQQAEKPILSIWIDDTSSVTSKSRDEAISNVSVKLPEIISESQIAVLEVCHFGEGAWNAPCRRFPVPQVQAVECAPPKIPGEWSRIRPMAQKLTERAEAVCRDRQAVALADYERATKTIEATVESEMRALKDANARCTAVIDVLQRIALTRGNRKALILTDGRQTCSGPAATPIQASANAVIVLITERSAARFVESKTALYRIAPWIKAIEPGFSDDLSSLFVTPPVNTAGSPRLPNAIQ
jgi:hypothetical protein